LNCEGPYKKAQRNDTRSREAVPPVTKALSGLDGAFGLDKSTVSFRVDEDFIITEEMLEGNDTAIMLINNKPVSSYMLNGAARFSAGSKVIITGDNGGAFDLLYWNFGVGRIEAFSPAVGSITMIVVY